MQNITVINQMRWRTYACLEIQPLDLDFYINMILAYHEGMTKTITVWTAAASRGVVSVFTQTARLGNKNNLSCIENRCGVVKNVLTCERHRR